MERQHAINAARNVLNSKIARALLEENKLPHRNLLLNVEKIKSDEKRNQALHANQKRQFKNRGLIYNFDPTIVVERPPSPNTALHTASGGESRTPHYMTDLKKNKQLPKVVSMPKVDAFRVTRKRKRNLWERNYSSRHMNEQFRSIILKSPPLTSEEQCDLDKGWTMYRPVSRLEESMRQMLASKNKNRERLAKSVKPNVTSSSEVFITQLTVQETESDIDHRQKSSAAVSELLRNKMRSTAADELNDTKLHQFEILRERQKKSYHRYLK